MPKNVQKRTKVRDQKFNKTSCDRTILINRLEKVSDIYLAQDLRIFHATSNRPKASTTLAIFARGH